MLIEIGQSTNEINQSLRSENLKVLQRIGAGSFATVYISHGGACAFKVVHNHEDAAIIRKEYRMLTNLYFSCNEDSFFKLPQPYAFHNPAPQALEVRGHGFTAETFRLIGITKATYVMNRIFVLPLNISQPIRQLYYPPAFKKASPPTLCRLYFGKVIDTPSSTSQGARQPSRFWNSANFPLDIARYSTLASLYILPDIEKVIAGMGDMLARIHWFGNYDGRDIEWVLGGDGYGDITYFVIDFNQMREWGKTMEGVDTLVSAFMTNDPYYPRPRPQNPQYQIFRAAYLAVCPAEQHALDIALAFLDGIEQEQSKRDIAAADARNP